MTGSRTAGGSQSQAQSAVLIHASASCSVSRRAPLSTLMPRCTKPSARSARADLKSDVVHTEQLRSLQHKSVKIRNIALSHRRLVSLVIFLVAVAERITTESMS